MEVNLEVKDDDPARMALQRTIARADSSKTISLMFDLNRVLIFEEEYGGKQKKWGYYGPFDARKYPNGILSVYQAALKYVKAQDFNGHE